MCKLFQNFFKPKPKDEFIERIINSSSENWDPKFTQIPKSSTELNLQDYLKANPHKEKLFLARLDSEFQTSQVQPKFSFNLKLILAVSSLSLIGFMIFLVQNIFSLKNYKISTTETQTYNQKFSFASFKVGETISTQENSQELIYNETLKFILHPKTQVQLEDLPPSNLSIFIKLGKIEILSTQKHDFSIYWTTKKSIYKPLGTIASLLVLENKEILEVREGSFLRKDKQTGQEKIISQNSQETFFYSKPTSSNLRYKLPGTVKLKDGQTFTGYYYEENNFLYLETPAQTLKISKSDIESIE